MIEFQEVSVQYGPQEVLSGVSVQINARERVGIVGPNGAGKSTLFQLVTGELVPTKGDVNTPSGSRFGHVRQVVAAASEEETLIEFTAHSMPELKALETRIHEVDALVRDATGPERERLLRQAGHLQSEFEHLGGYDMESRGEAALCGLGFKADELKRRFSEFSGGWQKRAELARVLIEQPDIMLLDEPSNYLDLPAIQWLQRYLRDFTGTMLLISHDRYLLRSLTTVTCEVYAGRVTRYQGGYDYFLEERERRFDRAIAAARNQEKKRAEIERFVDRFRYKATKATQVQSRIKMLARMDEIDAPPPEQQAGHIRLADPPHSGSETLRLEGIGVSYDNEHWVLDDVDLSITRGAKVAVVGYNGMGKTTLLRVMAGALTPQRGERVLGHHVMPGYQSQEFAETLPPDQSVLNIVTDNCPVNRRNSVRSVIGGFGFTGEDADKPCQVLSGGEKIRLAFAKIFVDPPNFLILDEPTTHLDIQGRQALENTLQTYSGTVCLVSHDTEFVRNVADHIVAVTPDGVREYPGGYDYYLQKSGADPSAESPSPARAAKKAEKSAPRVSNKELRKQRAAERQTRYGEAKRLKKEIADDEKKIAAFEASQSAVAEELANGGAGFDYEEANRRLKTIQDELATRMRRWEKNQAILEEM